MSANLEVRNLNFSIPGTINISRPGTIVHTTYDELVVIPAHALKNIDLSSVPTVIQEAIDNAMLTTQERTLADSIISDLREDLSTLEDGIHKKTYIDNKLSYLEQILSQKVNENQLASIIETKTALAVEGLATSSDIKALDSKINNNNASITQLEETITTKDAARASQINEVEAKVNEDLAKYSDVLDLTVNEDGSVKAEKIEELRVSISDQEGDLNALKKQVDGKVEYFEGAYSAVKEDFKPALVEPYKTWYETDIANGNTTLRDIHTGDTFEQYEVVNDTNEYKASWKFVKTALNYPNADEHGYCWSVMTNSVALDAYKKAVQAHQAIQEQEVKITDVRNIAQSADGKWTANADILITNPNGKLTGIEIDANNEGDGIKIHTSKLTLIDNGKQPFIYENGELILNAKTTFSNVKDVPDFATKQELNNIEKISDINWQVEIQKAIDADETSINSGKITAVQLLIDKINALGTVIAKDVVAETIKGKIFEAGVFRKCYIDLDGELEVLTDYHITKAMYNANPSLYIDAIKMPLPNSDHEYRIPSISSIEEKQQSYNIEKKIYKGKMFSYDAANAESNLKAVKRSPILKVESDVILLDMESFKYSGKGSGHTFNADIYIGNRKYNIYIKDLIPNNSHYNENHFIQIQLNGSNKLNQVIPFYQTGYRVDRKYNFTLNSVQFELTYFNPHVKTIPPSEYDGAYGIFKYKWQLKIKQGTYQLENTSNTNILKVDVKEITNTVFTKKNILFSSSIKINNI